MKDIKVTPLSLEKDLPVISSWDSIYDKDPRYDSIKHFILEDNIYYNLAEVIELNYEKFPIGREERAYSFAIKQQENLLGFILCCSIQILDDPELIIQYVVLNPDAQGKGIAKFAIDEILSNQEKYLKTKVNRVFAKIDRFNMPSRKMFSSIGFDLNYTNTNYLSASKELVNEKI